MPTPYRWPDHMRNTDVSSLTGLSPVLDPIVRRRSSLFGHVARLPEDTPAHQALRCHIDLSLGHLPDQSWRRCRNRWRDQLRTDNSTPPDDLWSRAVARAHSGVMLRSSTTTHLRRRLICKFSMSSLQCHGLLTF